MEKSYYLEEISRMTYEEAVKYLFRVVNEDDYVSISEWIADIEYKESIHYAKGKNLYDINMRKLSELISKINPTIELFLGIKGV